MNIIVINGSPGKDRNTVTLLKSAIKSAAGCRSALEMGKDWYPKWRWTTSEKDDRLILLLQQQAEKKGR